MRMPKLILVGFFLTLGSLLAIFIEYRYTELYVIQSIAKMYCGPLYLVEPDDYYKSQGIISDQACGMNADTYFSLMAMLLAILGIVFMVVGFMKGKPEISLYDFSKKINKQDLTNKTSLVWKRPDRKD